MIKKHECRKAHQADHHANINRQISSRTNHHKSLALLLFIVFNAYLVKGQIWGSLDSIKSGQVIVYDVRQIAAQIYHNITVTYQKVFDTQVKQIGVCFSGFENYISKKIQFSVAYSHVTKSSISIDLKVGDGSYMRQFAMNYIVSDDNTVHNMLRGQFDTFDLINSTDSTQQIRSQTFRNLTTQLGGKIMICMTAISGLKMISSQGTVNYLNVSSQLLSNLTIEHTVQTKGDNIVEEIQLTTVLINRNSLSLGYQYLQQHFTDTITRSQGFKKLDLMGQNGALDKQDRLYFGIRGFSFGMAQTRLFLLKNTSRSDNRQAMQTNNNTNSITIDFLLHTLLKCDDNANQIYYINGYSCISTTSCPGNQKTYVVGTCEDCNATCNKCSGGTDLCQACKSGQNRVKQNSGNSPCICNKTQGYVDNGTLICQKCNTLIQGCKICLNSQTCEECQQDFLPYEDDGNTICKCPDKKYAVSGMCLSFLGCLEARSIITGEYCDLCDQNSNYQSDLINNSTCVCKKGYFQNTELGVCEDNCGDKKAVEGKCDDGNTVGGDGCSPVCEVQYGFVCTQEEVGGMSECVPSKDIAITFQYAQKVLDSNQVILAFLMKPAHPFLAEQSFQGSFSTDIHFVKKLVRYDHSNSFIYMTLDYSQTLQKGDFEVNITFKGLEIYSDDISIPITLTGINAMVNYSEGHSINSVIELIAIIFAGLSFMITITALVLNQKLIGLELILPIQAAFFAISTFPVNKSPSSLAALWPLTFSTGYNIIETFDLSENYMLNSKVIRMHYAGQFFLNYNFSFCLVVLIIIVLAVISAKILYLQSEQRRLEKLEKVIEEKEKEKKDVPLKKMKKGQLMYPEYEESPVDNNQQNKQQNNVEKLQEIMKSLEITRTGLINWKSAKKAMFDRFFSILVLINIMPIYFAFSLQATSFVSFQKSILSPFNASLTIVVMLSVICGVYYIISDYKSDKHITFNCEKGKYVIIYVCVFFTYIVLVSAIMEFDFSVYVAFLFSVLPYILIVYQCPHQSELINFQTIIALICQLPFSLIVIVSIIIGTGEEINELEEFMASIYAFAILGSVGTANILTVVRLIKVFDIQRLSLFEFIENKIDSVEKKKNKVTVIQVEEHSDREMSWDQDSDDTVREIMLKKNKQKEIDKQMGYNQMASAQRKGEMKYLKKELHQQQNEDHKDDEEDDEADNMEIIKARLREQFAIKRAKGLIPPP